MTTSVPQPGSPGARPGPQPGQQHGAQPGPQQGPQPAPPAADGVPVTAALARLEGVHLLPLHDQPDVYQAVHTELQHALAAIDHA